MFQRSREVQFSTPVTLYAARPVSLPPVRGGVLDAPRLRDRRADLYAPAQRDQPRRRFPRCAILASATQRMQSRGHSPRTIGAARRCGKPTLSVHPRRAGVEARPYGGWLRGLTYNVIAPHLRRTNPSVTAQRAVTAPLSGEPRGGRKFAAFTHLFTAMRIPWFSSRP